MVKKDGFTYKLDGNTADRTGSKKFYPLRNAGSGAGLGGIGVDANAFDVEFAKLDHPATKDKVKVITGTRLEKGQILKKGEFEITY